jgi:phage shock protein PspC (stress-responsive transcriptional regulator)
MSIADELLRLEQMRDRGSISAEEFSRAKDRVLAGNFAAEPLYRSVNGFRRSNSDRWLGGVCGGLAISTGMESWLWRVIFALLLCVGGTGFLVYILLWFFVPVDDVIAQTYTP